MNKKIILLGTLIAASSLFGTNLVRNAVFSGADAKGKVQHFESRGKGSFSVKDGVLTLLGTEEGTILLIQRKLALVPGKKYLLAFDVKGLGGTYGVYLEYRNAENKIRGINSAFRPAPADWTGIKHNFVLPGGATDAYIVLYAGKKAQVNLRNLAVTEVK